MDIPEILKSVAPGLATALLGPLGGLAVTAIGKALDIPEATQEKIQTALSGATQEDLLKLKQADQQFIKDMRALDIDLMKVDAADRDSARRMAVDTQAKTPAVLSWAIVVATVFLEGWCIIVGIPEKADPVIIGRVLGTLDTAFVTVLAFWLGTSHASRLKDSTIGKLAG